MRVRGALRDIPVWGSGAEAFRVLYTIVVPIGALAQLDLVWILADTFNALMAFPNLIGVLLLSLWYSKPYVKTIALERCISVGLFGEGREKLS